MQYVDKAVPPIQFPVAMMPARMKTKNPVCWKEVTFIAQGAYPAVEGLAFDAMTTIERSVKPNHPTTSTASR